MQTPTGSGSSWARPDPSTAEGMQPGASELLRQDFAHGDPKAAQEQSEKTGSRCAPRSSRRLELLCKLPVASRRQGRLADRTCRHIEAMEEVQSKNIKNSRL